MQKFIFNRRLLFEIQNVYKLNFLTILHLDPFHFLHTGEHLSYSNQEQQLPRHVQPNPKRMTSLAMSKNRYLRSRTDRTRQTTWHNRIFRFSEEDRRLDRNNRIWVVTDETTDARNRVNIYDVLNCPMSSWYHSFM